MKLVLEHISKLYGDTAAVNYIDYSFGCGVYGLLGPNGAGKTTLMRMMTDLLKPTTGRVLLDDVDITVLGSDFRRRLGYLPQDFGFYPNFSAEQFLHYIARLKGLTRECAIRQSAELLDLVGLSDRRRQKMKQLSCGQRQRVGIAQALLADPDILILDEPTAGLDPEERIRFRNIISGLSREKMVLLSTHIVSDLEAIANEILLLKQGIVIACQTPHEMLSKIDKLVWSVSVSAQEEAELTERYPCSNVFHTEGKSILRLLSQTSPHPDALQVHPNMEDAYLYFLGK